MPEQRFLVATITGLSRQRNSPSGNPVYRVHTTAGTFVTEKDTALVYNDPQSWINRLGELHLRGDRLYGIRWVNSPNV